LKNLQEEVSTLRASMDEFPRRRTVLFDLYERGHITIGEFVERKAEHAERLAEMSSQTALKESQLEKLRSQSISRELLEAAAKHFGETFGNCDLAKKKQKLREVIESIVIKDHSFKINFRLSTTAD
jgi:beta-xylosidase